MYFLSDEERKHLAKRLLPKARETDVAEDLRGWNWHQPPLEPMYEVKLALFEIANQYCSSGRDLFLRRVMKVQAKPNKAMLFGSVFHEIVARLLVQVKKLIYQHGVANYKDIISKLETMTFMDVIEKEPATTGGGRTDLAEGGTVKNRAERTSNHVSDRLSNRTSDRESNRTSSGVSDRTSDRVSDRVSFGRFDEFDETEREGLFHKCQLLMDFECARIIGRMHDVLARQPYIGEDALAATVVPVVVEQKLDGSFLGLSSNLSADAFTFSEPMISDLKFGEPQRFHRLTTTGYSLVLEALHDFPISIGCVVYVQFRHGRIFVQRDFHLIDDELRQWFVEERDRKARMVADEIDPGLADECYGACPYLEYCRDFR